MILQATVRFYFKKMYFKILLLQPGNDLKINSGIQDTCPPDDHNRKGFKETFLY